MLKMLFINIKQTVIKILKILEGRKMLTKDFYDQLKLKYNDYLKPEIVSIVMIQTNDQVLLETREVEIVEGGFEKQTTVT